MVKISTDFRLEYDQYNGNGQINDLSASNDAILIAIHKYGRMLDVNSEVKRLFELYRTPKLYIKNESVKEFRSDRVKIGMKINFMTSRMEAIAELYEKFIKTAIKYAKILKDIEDPVSEKNPKYWNDLDIEDRAELIRLVYDRLDTCSDLLQYCNEFQETVFNVMYQMIDVLKAFNGISTMNIFVKKCNDLLENDWENVIDLKTRNSIDILMEKIVNKMNPVYKTLQRYKDERETFKDDLRNWKEKAYQVEIVDDSDSSTQPTPNKEKNIELNIKSVSDI